MSSWLKIWGRIAFIKIDLWCIKYFVLNDKTSTDSQNLDKFLIKNFLQLFFLFR